MSNLEKGDIEKWLRKENPCTVHAYQEVSLHCNDCDMLICTLCCKGHHNHKTTLLQEYIKIEKKSLSKNFKEIDNMIADGKKKDVQQQIALDIKADGEKAKTEIEQLAEKLISQITESKRKTFP